MAKPSNNSDHALNQHELRRVAVAAYVDPRSLVRYLHGEPMSSTTRLRIEAALTSCGYPNLLRSNGKPSTNGHNGGT